MTKNIPLINKQMKKTILEHLHKLLEDKGYKIVPQNYEKEFNQTGSGKSIIGKQNIPQATTKEINYTRAKIVESHIIAKKYKEALKSNDIDENGIIHFSVDWNGKTFLAKIPKQFRDNQNNEFYFETPTIGDGGFQVALDKNGKMTANNIKSKVDMQDNPDLTSATDAGYSKDYEGRTKYFKIKAGLLGKYQTGGYSIMPTPAMDAVIKTYIIFKDEILNFMGSGSNYTDDKKGTDIANQMNVEKKIEKIRKDAEDKIGKPISSNKTWLDYKSNLKNLSPEQLQNLDINTAINDLIDLYKGENKITNKSISLDKDELDAFEKRQADMKARLDAARLKKKLNEEQNNQKLFNLIFYHVIFHTNDSSDTVYYGPNKEKAYNEFESFNDIPTNWLNRTDMVLEITKQINQYKFIYELDDEFESIEDYPIDEYYDDPSIYKLINDGNDVQTLDSRTIKPINQNSDQLLNDVSNYFYKKYGNHKYNVINVKDENDNNIGCIKLRIADHTENINNIDRYESCNYHISVVIADHDVTKNRFGMSNAMERRNNELELIFSSNDDFNEIISDVEDIINDKIEIIKN